MNSSLLCQDRHRFSVVGFNPAMAVTQCICGERLDGSDEELFELFRAHLAAVHPDFPITEDAVRQSIEGWAHGDRWDGSRADVDAPIVVKPLGVDTLDD